MRRTVRTLAVLALTGAAVPFVGVSPAMAESSTEPASTGAYFYSAGIDKPDPAPAQPPNITGTATDGVASEHLAVAVRAPNQTDKLSFISFDLLAVPFEATISSAIVTVPLAENSQQNMQMSPGPEKVQACPADATGFNGQDGANTMGAPKTLCDIFTATATLSPDEKSYVFDVTAMAQSWLTEANNGMSIEPLVKSSAFQVVFLPFAESTIAVEYTATALEDIVPETFADAPVTDEFSTDVGSDTGTVDTGSSFSGGGADSGTSSFDGGSSLPDTSGFGGSSSSGSSSSFGSADAPLLSAELPADVPVADSAGAAPEVAQQRVATRAVGSFSESLSPTAGFFVMGLLLAGVLALLSLIMGDPRAPVASAGPTSRLSQALQSRQRVGGLAGRSTPSL